MIKAQKLLELMLLGQGINAAKIHASKSSKDIKYIEGTAESFYAENNERFDIVSCLEVLEHVPDPKELINVCVKLLKPGGGFIFVYN